VGDRDLGRGLGRLFGVEMVGVLGECGGVVVYIQLMEEVVE